MEQYLDTFKKNHKAMFADDMAKHAVEKVKKKGEDTTREEARDAGEKVLEAQRLRKEWEQSYNRSRALAQSPAHSPPPSEKSDTTGLSEYEGALEDSDKEPDSQATTVKDATKKTPKETSKETPKEKKEPEKGGSNPGGSSKKKIHKTPSEIEEESFMEEARILKLREEKRRQKRMEESAGKKGEDVTVKGKGQHGKGSSKPSDVIIPREEFVRPVLSQPEADAPAEGDVKRNRPSYQGGQTSRMFPCGSYIQQMTNKEVSGLKQCLKEPDSRKIERLMGMQYYHPRYFFVYLLCLKLLTFALLTFLVSRNHKMIFDLREKFNQHVAALDEFQRQDKAWKEQMAEDIETIKSALMHYRPPGDESEGASIREGTQPLDESGSEVSGVGFDVRKVVSMLQVY